MVVLEEMTSFLPETVFSESEDESTLTTVATASAALACFVGTAIADMDSLSPARMDSIAPRDGLRALSSSMLLLSEFRDEVVELCFLSFLPAAVWPSEEARLGAEIENTPEPKLLRRPNISGIRLQMG
jgi:hypothetical protein